MTLIANGLASIRSLALIAVIGLVAFNPITLAVIGGLTWEYERNTAAVEAVKAQHFAVSCKRYKAMSTFDRWTSIEGWEMGYCDKYLSRMD